MEPGGIEPPSRNSHPVASTCVVTKLDLDKHWRSVTTSSTIKANKYFNLKVPASLSNLSWWRRFIPYQASDINRHYLTQAASE